MLAEKLGFCFYIGKMTKKQELESIRGTIISISLTTLYSSLHFYLPSPYV